MEKILLAVDAVHPTRNALEFACYLARLTKSKITGVFLENLVPEERFFLGEINGLTYVNGDINEYPDEYTSRVKLVERNISHFKKGCINREVRFALHRNHGIPVVELIKESRFADMMVIDAETSFSGRYNGIPTEFVRDILQKAECPVIIAPENFEAVDEIIFTYNGSASSVFAIKQFTHLFPQFQYKKVNIVQVNKNGEWQDAQIYKFEEWLKDHYTDLHFEALKGETDSKLFDYAFEKENIFLVMGAYGRNSLSRFFKGSHADLLIKTVTQPIFIAHF